MPAKIISMLRLHSNGAIDGASRVADSLRSAVLSGTVPRPPLSIADSLGLIANILVEIRSHHDSSVLGQELNELKQLIDADNVRLVGIIGAGRYATIHPNRVRLDAASGVADYDSIEVIEGGRRWVVKLNSSVLRDESEVRAIDDPAAEIAEWRTVLAKASGTATPTTPDSTDGATSFKSRRGSTPSEPPKTTESRKRKFTQVLDELDQLIAANTVQLVRFNVRSGDLLPSSVRVIYQDLPVTLNFGTETLSDKYRSVPGADAAIPILRLPLSQADSVSIVEKALAGLEPNKESVRTELGHLQRRVESGKLRIVGFVGTGVHAQFKIDPKLVAGEKRSALYYQVEVFEDGQFKVIDLGAGQFQADPTGGVLSLDHIGTRRLVETLRPESPTRSVKESQISPARLSESDLLASRSEHKGLQVLVQNWLDFKYATFKRQFPGHHDWKLDEKGMRLRFFRELLSGRHQDLVEDFLNTIRPYYANSHSEISATGLFATALLELAQQSILNRSGAGKSYVPIQVHQGDLGACDRFARIMKQRVSRVVPPTALPVIYVHPESATKAIWESNGFVVKNIPVDWAGTVDQAQFRVLVNSRPNPPIHIHLEQPYQWGSDGSDLLQFFDGQSSEPGKGVTYSVTSLKSDIRVTASGSKFAPAAIFRSESLQYGGEGANGSLVVHPDWLSDTPSVPGGGTVDAVTSADPNHAIYAHSAVERENAGTPNLEAWLRAALGAELSALVSNSYVAARKARAADRLGHLANWQPMRSPALARATQRSLEQHGIRSVVFRHYVRIEPEFYWSKADINDRIIPAITVACQEVDAPRARPFINPRITLPQAIEALVALIERKHTQDDLEDQLLQIPEGLRIPALTLAVVKIEHPDWVNDQGQLKERSKSAFLDDALGKGAILASPVEKAESGLRLSSPYQVYTDFPASGKAHQTAERVIEILQGLMARPSGRELLDQTAINTILRAHSGNQAKQRLDELHYVDVPNGSTGALDLATRMLVELKTQRRTPGKGVVFVSEYEHHSNILTWQSQGFDVEMIPMTDQYQIDWKALKQKIGATKGRFQVVSVSGASNVIGSKTDLDQLASIKTLAPEIVIGLDVAARGPHDEVDLARYKVIDFVCRSDHKLVAGPGSNGGLIFREGALTPAHLPAVYTGTEHNTTALLKSAIAISLQTDVLTWQWLHDLEAQNQKAFFKAVETYNAGRKKSDYSIEVYGAAEVDKRTSITSFNLVAPNGKRLHQHLVAQILNDVFGIQVRSGCNCAGPLGVRLIYGKGASSKERDKIDAIVSTMLDGASAIKPGWVRTDVGLLTADERDYLFSAIAFIATHADDFLSLYELKRSKESGSETQWKASWGLRSGARVDFPDLLECAIFRNRAEVSLDAYRAFLKNRVREVEVALGSFRRSQSYTAAQKQREDDKKQYEAFLAKKIKANGKLPGTWRTFPGGAAQQFRFFKV